MKDARSLIAYLSAVPSAQLFILVGGFSLFIRIYLYAFHPPYDHLVTDARWYYTIAANLSNGDGFIYSQNPTAYRPVGTSLILAIFFKFFGIAPFVSASVFCGFFVLLLVQGYQLAKSLFNTNTAKLTLILFSLWPEWWFHSLMPMSDLLFTSLLLTFFNQLVRRNPQSMKTGVLLGFLLACLVLTRSVGIFALPILFIYYYKYSDQKTLTRTVITSCVVMLLTLSPYLYRNYQQFGFPLISNNGGINLHIGHNDATTGAYMRLPIPDSLKDADERRFNLWHRSQAHEYMRAKPQYILINIPKKLAYGFIYHISIVQGYFQGTPKHKRQSRFFWMAVSQATYFFLIASLAMLYTRKRAFLNDKTRLFVYGYTAATVMTISLYFGSDRFIMPILPLWLMVVAHWAIDWATQPPKAQAVN